MNKMKTIIPLSSLVLALAAFYLKSIYASLHTGLVYLYTIDGIDDRIRSKMLGLNDDISRVAIVVALTAVAIAAVSWYTKSGSRVLSAICLAVAIGSTLFSLLVFV